MGKSAILSTLVCAEEPYNGGKQDDRRFHEEVALLAHPRLIEVKHYCIGTFVCVGNVGHELRGYRVASVRPLRIVEIYDAELRHYALAITVFVPEQVIHGYQREVRELEVIYIAAVTMFYTLFYIIVDNGV